MNSARPPAKADYPRLRCALLLFAVFVTTMVSNFSGFYYNQIWPPQRTELLVKQTGCDPVEEIAVDPVGEAVEDPVGEAVEDPVGGAVEDPVGGAVEDSVGEAVEDVVGEAVEDPVGEAVEDAVGEAVEDAVGEAAEAGWTAERISYDQIHGDGIVFNQTGRDVLVFLHIQKTGGSQFELEMVNNLNSLRSCDCLNRNLCLCRRAASENRLWMFGMSSSNWMCGVHPAWTWLVDCVHPTMNRLERESYSKRYFFTTLLRDPVMRYLSEWNHVRNKGGWDSINWCTAENATTAEIPGCFLGKEWSDVTLDDFLQCASNMANNRETWMLADLRLVQCYNNTSDMSTSQRRDQILLQSAKDNLQRMSFFGLTERQRKSQWMFERTFGMRFLEPLVDGQETSAPSRCLQHVNDQQLQRVKRSNYLDLQLYDYAMGLFNERLASL